jgi:DNA mismatch endonuclease, patch repair protein
VTRQDGQGLEGVPAAVKSADTGGRAQPAGRKPGPLSPLVSAQMSRMPRVRTNPEMRLRRELHRRGLRYRVNHPSLPGRPDIAFTKVRLAVFVDGCFWHMCPQHSTMPKNNAEWWAQKLQRNVARDREKDAQLMGLGWSVLHAWEHENPEAVADTIEGLVRDVRDNERNY